MADYDFTYTGAEIQAILDTGKKLKDSGYIFLGVATPSTNPGTPTQKVYYEAKQAGTYTNFGGVVLPDGISLLIWNGSWTSETVMCGDGGVFDISVYKSTGGTLATFADLSAALNGGNNIPVNARKGGMSIKFVQSSDNKYVQFRCMANSFTTDTTQWQGVDDEPTAGSDNLVKSGGVEKFTTIPLSVEGYLINSIWYQGYYDTSVHRIVISTKRVISDYISVVPQRHYLIDGMDKKYAILMFDKNLNYVGYKNWYNTTDASDIFLNNDNVAYIRLGVANVDDSDLSVDDFSPNYVLKIKFNDEKVDLYGGFSVNYTENGYQIVFSDATIHITGKIDKAFYSITQTLNITDTQYVVININTGIISVKAFIEINSSDIILLFAFSGKRGIYSYMSYNPLENGMMIMEEISNLQECYWGITPNNRIIFIIHMPFVTSEVCIRMDTNQLYEVSVCRSNKLVCSYGNNIALSEPLDYIDDTGWKKSVIYGNYDKETYKYVALSFRKSDDSQITKDGVLSAISYLSMIDCYGKVPRQKDRYVSGISLVDNAVERTEKISFFEKVFTLDNLIIEQGVRYDNNFPTINNSSTRITAILNTYGIPLKNCSIKVELEDDTLEFSPVQRNSGTGWLESGMDFLLLKDSQVGINIHKKDNSNISPADVTSINVRIYGIAVLKGESSGIEDEMKLYAQKHFINNMFFVASHAVNNPCGLYSNTKAAILNAALSGYKVLENDIRMTSDNIPILFHDNTITINGVTKNVEEWSYNDLLAFTYPDGQKICTLEEELQICHKYNICLLNDLKARDNSAYALCLTWTMEKLNIVVSLLKKYLGYGRFTITSMGDSVIKRLRNVDYKLMLGFTTFRGQNSIDTDMLLHSFRNMFVSVDYGASVDENDKYSYATLMEILRNNNIPYMYWTPTVLDCMRIANEPVCRGVISNSYINKNANHVDYSYRSGNQFEEDDRVSHTGMVLSGILKLQQGEKITIETGNRYCNNLIINIEFDGKLNITSLDHGYGQDTEEYPTGILNPAGTLFESGNYIYGIRTGINLFNNSAINIEAIEETTVFVLNIDESY